MIEGENSFRGRLQQLIDRVSGGNRAAFARATAIDPGSIRDYLAGGQPSMDKLVAIAAAGGVSIDWLVRGPKKGNNPFSSSSWIEIPLLAFKASGGTGSVVIQDDGGRFPILRSVLDRLGLREENARALVLSGESMLPTIGDGDTLVLDISRREIVEGKVYAFTIGDEAFIKRLRRSPGRIMMISDNSQAFPPEAIPPAEDFRIIGQVRWAERQL